MSSICTRIFHFHRKNNLVLKFKNSKRKQMFKFSDFNLESIS